MNGPGISKPRQRRLLSVGLLRVVSASPCAGYLRLRPPDIRGPDSTISFAGSSAVGSRLFLFAVTSPGVAVIMAPSPSHL